jgi:hypothetical protein
MIGIQGSARRCGAVGVALFALVVTVASCGRDIVTNDSLEDQVKSRLGTDSANCPADLRREVGQSTVCTARRGDETYDVTVTITGVDRDPPELAVERASGGGPPSASSTSTSSATSTSTADSVEEQVRSRLGTDGADCPADLAGQVGRTMICRATRGDDAFDVRVTVTAVRADAIDLLIERVGGTSAPAAGGGGDVVSADPSTTIPGDKVAQSVQEQLTERGEPVDRVSCPDLAARVGASQRCTLVSRGATYGVTVAVTSVQGTDVRFGIQVDQTPQ